MNERKGERRRRSECTREKREKWVMRSRVVSLAGFQAKCEKGRNSEGKDERKKVGGRRWLSRKS